jgi:MscS family membrane protein
LPGSFTLGSFLAASLSCGWFYSGDVNRQVAAARDDLEQATQALDLSEVPPALRQMTGVATLLMLRSVLLYDLSQEPGVVLPNREQVQRDHISSWTLPDTPISLAALRRDGRAWPQACRQCSPGDFLFTSDTLAGVQQDFEQIFRDSPELRRRFGADLFVYWALAPGGAVPPKLFFRLPVAVRRQLLQPIAGQSWLQWLLLIPISLLALLGVLGWQWFAIDWINLIGAAQATTLLVSRLLQGLLQALLLYLLAETLGQLLVVRGMRLLLAPRMPALSQPVLRRQGAGQILTLCRVIGVFAAAVAVIQTGRDLGVSSMTLLALSSVPALAISLGTQQLIRDMADGFSLLLDGQIKTGDACTIGTSKSGEIKGVIRSLGMRSMRIQQADGSAQGPT